MKKYTPGPWLIGSNKFQVLNKKDPAPFSLIAETHFGWEESGTGRYGQSTEEAEANAKLIAAAPEMVEALQVVEQYFRPLAPGEEARLVHDEKTIYRFVRIALATAGIGGPYG